MRDGKIRIVGILLFVFCLSFPVGYGTDSASFDDDERKLFSLLTPDQSGVAFINSITDTKEANTLIYEAFYEGGGVAIGDINNDRLPDIYFAGNQVEDRLYLNQGGLKFKDITEEAGILSKGGWSTGINMIDINLDGHLDIYVCKSLYDDFPDLRINELYINNGDLTFTESAAQYGVNDHWRTIHANFFDYDRDKDFDMFIIDQPPNPSILSPMEDRNYLDAELTYRLLENNNGRFKDITKKSGLTNVGFGLSAVSSDFNNDGWIDLYVANDYEGPDFLYMNNGDGTFTNKIDDLMQHISFFSMGADAGDINNDGNMDLLVVDMVAEDNYRLKANMGGMNPQQFWEVVKLGGHYQYMFNALQLNNGVVGNKQVFSDIAQMAGVASTDWSWSPLFADFDNDGLKDIFVTNGIKRDVRSTDALKALDLYIQQSVNTFTEQNPNEGDVSIWDIVSLDTLLNIFPSQKIINYIYQNLGDLTFEKKMTDWGVNQPTFSSGAAYGDLDNDGDLDLVVNNVDEVAYVYMNNAESLGNNYLSVRFAESNKAVSNFGTRATIYYQGKQQTSEITSARGFFSSSDPIIHFGLEKVKRVDSLVIHWYDGGVSSLKRIKANQTLTLDRAKMESRESKRSDRIVDDYLFEDITEQIGFEHIHQENDFDDYEREILLPHKMSMLGPGIAVGDVNADGLEDFFIGGAAGKSGKIFLQGTGPVFREANAETYSSYPYHEDTGAEFFDADNDGDQDLYVVSGGNEYKRGVDLYQDRLYINDGTGIFSLNNSALPQSRISGSCVISHDFDSDGDVDLFVCGRQVPGKYPEPAESQLLRNELVETGKAAFSKTDIDGLDKLGMVTDAVWSDFDGDGDKDLIAVGEWMAITIFENREGVLWLSDNNGLLKTNGWWNSIAAADLDGDGDQDYVVGNLGKNYKYRSSPTEPFTVNYGDFDDNGTNDIILGYYNYGEHYPLRGRSCSAQQAPVLASSFPTYSEFASSSLAEVYGSEFLNKSLEYQAFMFESVVLINGGKGRFDIMPLPNEAQISNINDVLIGDLNGDEKLDLIIAGNMYGSEIETPRNDAGIGLYLIGNGDGTFQPVPMTESGLYLPYDVKKLKMIKLGNGYGILVGVNDGPVRLIKLQSLNKGR